MTERVCEPSGVILFRMTRFTPATRVFAERLERESGHRVVCLVDERGGPIDVSPFPKVSLTDASCEALGIYCPPDMAWRCGDYGFYLARVQYPQASHFWLIEYDVRVSGTDLSTFFGFFEPFGETDLIAAQYRPADRDWYWRHALPARKVVIHRCLFPLVRLTASAVDRLLARRRQMSRKLTARISWPNDESLVATTLSNDGSLCRDLNGFGRTFYTDETFSYFTPFNGDVLKLDGDDGIVYHPVLFDQDYTRKLTRLGRRETRSERFRRRCAKVLNAVARW